MPQARALATNIWHFRALMLALLLCSAPSGFAATSFSDNTFNDADWELVTFAYNVYPGSHFVPGNAGSASGTQSPVGGVEGAYRRVSITVFDAPSTYWNSVYTVSLKPGAAFDPSQQGPITSIDFDQFAMTTSVIPSNGCNCQQSGFALRQNGKVYIDGAGWTTASASGDWRRFRATFTASDLCQMLELAPCPDHPDFSASGGTIEFGFYTANGNNFGAIGFTSVGGSDNWSVTINQAPGPGEVTDSVRVRRATGGQISVSWQSSGCQNASDYSVYEGTIGNWYDYLPKTCTDFGVPFEETFTPGPGNTYYLVVAEQPGAEGSYGRDSRGRQRPRSTAACMSAQVLSSCP